MEHVKIRLQSIAEVKDFVNTIAQFEGCFDLVSGRYIVDAKSVMGIFSMDLSQDLELRILDARNKDKEVLEALKTFIKER